MNKAWGRPASSKATPTEEATARLAEVREIGSASSISPDSPSIEEREPDELLKLRRLVAEGNKHLLDMLRAPHIRMSAWATTKGCTYLGHPTKSPDDPSDAPCCCGRRPADQAWGEAECSRLDVARIDMWIDSGAPDPVRAIWERVRTAALGIGLGEPV